MHKHSCGFYYECIGKGSCAVPCFRRHASLVKKGKATEGECLCTKAAPKFTSEMEIKLLKLVNIYIPMTQNIGRKEKLKEHWNKLAEQFAKDVGFMYSAEKTPKENTGDEKTLQEKGR